MTQLTLYRCYWPTAFHYLKSLQAGFRAESFGLLMTLDVSNEQAQKITSMMPFGSVIEQIDLDSYIGLDNRGIDELLLYQPVERTLEAEAKKN
jgi:hypothetical protein